MPEITKTITPQPVPRYVWNILTALTVFVYFFGLTLPFLGPDEARYAQVGREMFERGDWITPTLGGFNWFEKPALLYWLEIAAYKFFGINEFAARFGPALFGLGTVVSLWILGGSLATENTEKPTYPGENSQPISKVSVNSVANNFANWLALIAASTLGILVFSRGASFDIIITFPLTAALVSFYIYDSHVQPPAAAGGSDPFPASPRPRVPASLLLFYIFIGISLLAKGLIGIVFPFAIVGFYYVLSRRLPGRAFVFSLIWGTLLAVGIAAIWYLPIYQRHGYEFINEFFIQHHFQRFTSNKFQHPQPFYFFFWILPLMTLPWLPFFFAAIWKLIRGIFQRRDEETRREIQIESGTPRPGVPASPRLPFSLSPLLLFSLSWLIVPLAFFSISGSKLPGYILPAVPAAIILTAAFVFELVRSSNKWRNGVLFIAAGTLVTMILLLISAVPRFAETDSVKSLIQTANERGYKDNRVLMMHTISHNAEFYAAGRLVRDESGKQRRLYTVDEILAEIAADNRRSAVVLIPLEYLTQLKHDERIKTEVLKDNGELAVVIVSAK